MADAAQKVLTKEVLIPLGITGTIAVLASSAGAWVVTLRMEPRLAGIERTQAELLRGGEQTAATLGEIVANGIPADRVRWELWTERMRRLNPTLNVPDPPK